MKYLLCIICVLCFSCKETRKDEIASMAEKWRNKEIAFPERMIFTTYGMDTIDYHLPPAEYTIVSYIDSTGCTPCKLDFLIWIPFIDEVVSINDSVSFLFVFQPKGKEGLAEINYLMKRDEFNYPVWIDNEGLFHKINKLPQESMFHSFLIDNQNKVVMIGNPFVSPQIKALYLKAIRGKVLNTE